MNWSWGSGSRVLSRSIFLLSLVGLKIKKVSLLYSKDQVDVALWLSNHGIPTLPIHHLSSTGNDFYSRFSHMGQNCWRRVVFLFHSIKIWDIVFKMCSLNSHVSQLFTTCISISFNQHCVFTCKSGLFYAAYFATLDLFGKSCQGQPSPSHRSLLQLWKHRTLSLCHIIYPLPTPFFTS